MYNEENDYELLYLISENDEDAYNELHKKYSKLIKTIAKRIYFSSKYLGFSFEDIYDEGLCGFHSAVINFDEQEGILFYTYVITIITNRMITFVRNCNRNKHNILSDAISLNKTIDDDNNTMDNFIIVSEQQGDISYDLEKDKQIIDFKYELPFLHSLVYELRLNNFNNKEISVLLNISYKKIDNVIRDIRDRFLNRIKIME